MGIRGSENGGIVGIYVIPVALFVTYFPDYSVYKCIVVFGFLGTGIGKIFIGVARE